MEFITIDYWDDEVWEVWCPIYEAAFGKKNGKQKHIIRNMFLKSPCFFHIGRDHTGVQVIALTGKLPQLEVLLIDYLAVSKKRRNEGIGRTMVQYLKKWAMETGKFDGIVIEAEADDTQENEERIRFWLKCGFNKTEYIHQYKVVPEPYRAMYIKLKTEADIPKRGEDWFRHIGLFHRQSFQGAS
ncbi:GNAT family N-acetyltransferase [Niallia oryzisoli]|uniref:GNAT family N-acetyltransferase n=1 Tax=Niallia oryzisoli TaxID=1737571 RepID=A0ABZ2C6A5_9BACI